MKNVKYFFILLIPFTLFGISYDTPLLQISSKLFPKILFMEKETKTRIHSSINFVIIASPSNQEAARHFMTMLLNQYPEGINNIPIRVSIISTKEALNIKNVHGIIFMLSPDDPLLEPIIQYSYDTEILTFCFDPLLLRSGVIISVHIGKSIKPYLNISALKETSFNFEYSFIKLSMPYE